MLDSAVVSHLIAQVSQLELLVKERGHILEKSPKGHPELAGVGIQYCWGKAKMHFRRNKKQRVETKFLDLINECLSLDVLPLARIRKFARKAADMRKLYKNARGTEDTSNYEVVQNLYKECKAHRSAIDQFYKFTNET